MRRLRERADTPVADALLNQRVLAGIGNVYKSEVLFMCGVNPFAPVRTLDDAALDAAGRDRDDELLQGERSDSARADDDVLRAAPHHRARRAEGAALGLRPRRSAVPPMRHTDLVKKQGPDARLTYWCPVCQA